VRIDHTAWPFVFLACLPAAAGAWLWPPVGAVLLVLPIAVALFFRDPDRTIPEGSNLVVAPADGRVMYAGDARPHEAPPGDWRQVTVFLSVLDVHINRAPASGRVVRVERLAGTFLAAFKPESYGNTRSEIWLDHGGTTLVFRQVVGVLARRIVCRVRAGDEVATGARIGLMKFGSRMDVFVPLGAELQVREGDRLTAGETIIARFPERLA
jgi:phosphatidylserine decarboxylase